MSGYFTVRALNEVHDSTHEKIEIIRNDMRDKGMLLARNVALSSASAIAFKNYSFLREVMSSIVHHDKSISYGIIMSQSGMALIHTDISKAGMTLDGPTDKLAVDAQDVAAFDVSEDGHDYLEVVAPIEVGGKLWGKVRFGLSLEALNDVIRRSDAAARANVLESILTGVGAAILLIWAGSYLGFKFSRRLTRPLDSLLEGVRFIQHGDMDRRVTKTGNIPEFELLGEAFNEMAAAVKKRQADLEDALRKTEEAYRLKTQFLANVSHELRTPLNALINVPMILLKDFTTNRKYECQGCGQQYAIEEAPEGEELPKSVECPECSGQAVLEEARAYQGDAQEHVNYLEMGLQSAQHLLNVVNDLLDASKLEAGKMELFMTRFHLRQVFDEVSQTCCVLAKEKNINVIWPETDGENDEITADYVKLSQMLLNLMSNAIKFTPQDGKIVCSVDGLESKAPDARVSFAVRDSGEGIPEDKLGIIFESFRQVDGGHTRRHNGTGLGLAITRQLAQLHGGEIRVESEVGKGSTFTFEIPRYAEVKSVVSYKAQGNKKNKKVVVVDDEPIQLSLMFKVLTDGGYDVVTVKSPREGIEVVEQIRPDLAIFDVMMPDISGLSLLRRIREDGRFQNLPVVISTGFSNHSEMVKSLGAHWLAKPWQVTDLLNMVELALSGPSLVASGTVGAERTNDVLEANMSTLTAVRGRAEVGR